VWKELIKGVCFFVVGAGEDEMEQRRTGGGQDLDVDIESCFAEHFKSRDHRQNRCCISALPIQVDYAELLDAKTFQTEKLGELSEVVCVNGDRPRRIGSVRWAGKRGGDVFEKWKVGNRMIERVGG